MSKKTIYLPETDDISIEVKDMLVIKSLHEFEDDLTNFFICPKEGQIILFYIGKSISMNNKLEDFSKRLLEHLSFTFESEPTIFWF